VAYLKAKDSLYAAPILYGLGVFVLVLVCGVCLGWLAEIGKRLNSVITPARAKAAVRDWLDSLAVEVRTLVPLDDQIFFYIATLNGRKLSIRQMARTPRYLYFRAAVTFTPDDNRALAESPGGIDAIIRDLRLRLVMHRIGFGGIGLPLTEITVTKELFMSDDFNESQFVETLYAIEGAVVLINEVARIPNPTAILMPLPA
jgi:hypothetical protein